MRSRTWVSGPVIDIGLGAPKSQLMLEKLPAIIDTGASVICVDSRVPKRLGLASINRKPMQMADGREVMATSYLARMTVEDLAFDELVEIYGVPMVQPSDRVLLGRAFLRSYIITYNGLEERFYYVRSQPSPHSAYEEYDG